MMNAQTYEEYLKNHKTYQNLKAMLNIIDGYKKNLESLYNEYAKGTGSYVENVKSSIKNITGYIDRYQSEVEDIIQGFTKNCQVYDNNLAINKSKLNKSTREYWYKGTKVSGDTTISTYAGQKSDIYKWVTSTVSDVGIAKNGNIGIKTSVITQSFQQRPSFKNEFLPISSALNSTYLIGTDKSEQYAEILPSTNELLSGPNKIGAGSRKSQEQIMLEIASGTYNGD